MPNSSPLRKNNSCCISQSSPVSLCECAIGRVYVQGRVYALNDVWIRPPFGGKGRKMTGQLEAHANGFRYSSPKGDQLDIMYRCAHLCLMAGRELKREEILHSMGLHRGHGAWQRLSPRSKEELSGALAKPAHMCWGIW